MNKGFRKFNEDAERLARIKEENLINFDFKENDLKVYGELVQKVIKLYDSKNKLQKLIDSGAEDEVFLDVEDLLLEIDSCWKLIQDSSIVLQTKKLIKDVEAI